MRLIRGLLCLLPALLRAQELPVEKGAFKLHLIQHAIGEERYEISRAPDSSLLVKITSEQADRGNLRNITAALRLNRDLTPANYEVKSRAASSVSVDASTVTVREDERERRFAAPPRYFVGFGSAPFSVQMMMLRYWLAHGKPAQLPILRAAAGAPDARIEFAGHDTIDARRQDHPAGSLHHRQPSVRPRDSLDGSGGQPGGRDDFCRRPAGRSRPLRVRTGVPAIVPRRRRGANADSCRDRTRGAAGAFGRLRHRRRDAVRRYRTRAGPRFGRDRA